MEDDARESERVLRQAREKKKDKTPVQPAEQKNWDDYSAIGQELSDNIAAGDPPPPANLRGKPKKNRDKS